jgi:hypothetical protein
MALYVRSSDNAVVGIVEIRAAHPDKSIPDGIDHADLGFPLLVDAAQPAPLPWHRVVAGPVVGNATTWVQQPMSAADIEAILVAALDAHFDATANQRRYRDRYTCSVRAGYVGPFQAEGVAFATWMDACNALGYQIMAEVKAGTRAIPTPAELVAAMPAMVWPA